MEQGFVKSEQTNRITTITFFHPKSNSLPSEILSSLASHIEEAGKDTNTIAIILKSEGEKTFCAGASFDELLQINNLETGRKFFMGFANVINAMRVCPHPIYTRVQGKATGGGVGVIAASDYTFALHTADIKLSELNVGIGPFVIGPAVERKIGSSSYTEMALDADWKSATWAKEHGLYNEIFPDIQSLDASLENRITYLLDKNPEAIRLIKRVSWKGTEDWTTLLKERAEMSGTLVLSEFTKKYIEKFKKG